MLKQLYLVVCMTVAIALGITPQVRVAHAAPPMRIAYFEQGQFWLFPATYSAFQEELKKYTDISVVYPKELQISPGWETTSADMQKEAKRLFAAKPDMIIAAGTGAVQALLATNDGITPIIGIAIADPLTAGFMKSATESVAPNFICEVFLDRWRNMFRVFHDVIGFKKMGILYPVGESGRVYTGIDDAEAAAAEYGFTVLSLSIPDESPQACARGIDELHKMGADAFFMGPLNCFDWTRPDLVPLLDRIHGYNMPTFARDGSKLVQRGALMGFSTWTFSSSGMRLATAAREILKGASPATLPMVGVVEPLIALNLKTTRLLGIDLPFDVLVAADEIYENQYVQTSASPQE